MAAGVKFLDWYGDGSVHVVDIGLACCTLEFESASADLVARSEPPTSGAVLIVVSGTVTDALMPAVRDLVTGVTASVPSTPLVVSFGACTSAGGPYWDSYAVTKGVDQFLDVAWYVPGCPPPPGALHEVCEAVRQGHHDQLSAGVRS
ncbi:NADH-quinone oxidoreductase subunit B [Propionibacteriaceae bacterium Y1685]